MTFADWLRNQIETRGLSQYQVAKAAGISLGRVAAYVSGKSEPTMTNARRLCRALGVSLATLDREIDWDGDPVRRARRREAD